MTRTLLWRRQARRQARLDARAAPSPDVQAQTLDQLLARRDAGVSSVAINADAVYAAIKSYGSSFRPDPIAVDARCADAAARAIGHLDLAAARLRDLNGQGGSRPDRSRADIVREAGASLAAQMISLLDAAARARRLHQFYREQMREAVAHCASAGDTARAIQDTLDHSARARLDAYQSAYRAERARRTAETRATGETGEASGEAASFAPVKLVDRLPPSEPAARLVREALAQIERNLHALDALQAWAQPRADRLERAASRAAPKRVSALDADRVIAAWRADFAAPLPRRATPLPALLRR
jgi:hypothetical protein